MSKHLVFCADLQARESVYRHNPNLRDDDLVALHQVIEFCNDRANDVAILVLGGDQVDSPSISDKHVIKLRRLLRGCKVPTYYVDGNHEKGFSRFELEGGQASVASNLETSPISKHDIPAGCIEGGIAGYNWRPRREWESLKDEIPICDILVLHGFADQAAPLIQGSSVSAEDHLGDFDLNWFDGKCKLCLMGDIHIYTEYVGDKGTKFIYPGSMWMHRVNEPENKFFLSVDLDTLETTKIPLMTRPFYRREISTAGDITALQEEIFLKEVKVLDSRITKPRVHLDITSEEDLTTSIQELSKTNFVVPRVKPSETSQLITQRLERPDVELGIKALLTEEGDEDLRVFLAEVFRDSIDSALIGLRDKLGVM